MIEITTEVTAVDNPASRTMVPFILPVSIVLIRRLTAIPAEAERKTINIYTFEEAGLRYLEEKVHKPSAETTAMHLDQLFPLIGSLPITRVHDDTLINFINHETGRGISPPPTLLAVLEAPTPVA